MALLSDVKVGDTLDYGAYGPCTVKKVEHRLAGWNGKVPITEIWFTCGLGFTQLSDRAARMVYRPGDWIEVVKGRLKGSAGPIERVSVEQDGKVVLTFDDGERVRHVDAARVATRHSDE